MVTRASSYHIHRLPEWRQDDEFHLEWEWPIIDVVEIVFNAATHALHSVRSLQLTFVDPTTPPVAADRCGNSLLEYFARQNGTDASHGSLAIVG